MSKHALRHLIVQAQKAYRAATGRDATAICVPSPELRTKIEPIAKERGLTVDKDLTRLPAQLFSLDGYPREDANA